MLGSDCIDAKLVEASLLSDVFNFSKLASVYRSGQLGHRLAAVPVEQELLIYNQSRLLINMEFCVNTLRDECREFFAIYGRDGSDLRAPSRFPCYYSKERNDTVITKFSRKQAIFELTLTAAVPGALFVFSCSCLVLCTKVVGIGPDAHMKLMGCRRKRAAEDGSNNAQTIQATELLPGNETETATTTTTNLNGKSNRTADANHSKQPLSI